MKAAVGKPRLLVRRAIARFLDVGGALTILLLVVAVLTSALADFVAGEEAALLFGYTVVFLAFAVYEITMVAKRGQTLGRMTARVAVCKLDGGLPGWRASALRHLPTALLIVPGIGWVLLPVIYLWALADKDGRGMHDMLAGTQVVAVSRGARAV